MIIYAAYVRLETFIRHITIMIIKYFYHKKEDIADGFNQMNRVWERNK